MNKERELKNQIKAITKKFDAELKPLEKEMSKLKEAAELKLMQSYVGKCFKIRNYYSSDNKWWLYQKILRVEKIDRVNRMIVLNAEKDSYGSILISTQNGYYKHSFDNREKIKSETFDKHFNELLKEIDKDE